MDMQGNFILPIEYDRIEIYSKNGYAVKKGENWFDVDFEGNEYIRIPETT